MEAAAQEARERAAREVNSAPDDAKKVNTGDLTGAARDARLSIDHRRRAVSHDAVSANLRFVAREARITTGGVEAVGTDGSRLRIDWADMSRIYARMLPTDPPFGGYIFVDLAADTGPPIRLLATSRVNYAVMPGGAGKTSGENFRRLVRVAHQQARRPPAPEETLFINGRQPRRFESVKAFQAYDSAYDSA